MKSTAENSAAYRDVRAALASELSCGWDEIDESGLGDWQDIINRLEERDLYRTLLAELVEVLKADLPLSVSFNARVRNRFDDACRGLGDAYHGYIGLYEGEVEERSVLGAVGACPSHR